MKSPKVSIAMALYNGESFLVEQLETIANQTYKPYELIACDDGSTDLTASVFCEYVKKNNLLNYRYYKNKQQLGYSRNFIHAAEICKGDIVMFSDQDDVWELDKIEKIIKVFQDNTNAEAVFCAYEPFEEKGKTKRSIVEILKRFNYRGENVRSIPFSLQVRTMLSGGLTLAVRKSVLDKLASDILRLNMVYDIPIGLFCSSRGTLYYLPEVLVHHRIHSSNAGSPDLSLMNRIKDINRHIKGRNIELDHLKKTYTIVKQNIGKKEQKLIENEINHREKSIICMEKRKLGYLFLSLFRNNKYSNRIISLSNFVCCLCNLNKL